MLQEVAENQIVDAKMLKQFKNEDKLWKQRVKKVKYVCFETASYFCQASMKERLPYQVKVHEVSSKLPDERMQCGLQDLVHRRASYTFKTTTDINLRMEKLNFNTYNVHATHEPEVYFDFFI